MSMPAASPSPVNSRKISTTPASLASPSPNGERTLAERLSAPPKQLFHKKVAGYEGVKSKEASPEPPGKKTYPKSSTGFCAPGGGQYGHPREEVLSPSPTRLSKKQSETAKKPEQALVVGSEQRMSASVQRQRELAPHASGKKPGDSEKKASNFASAGYLEDTLASSARRESRLQKERKEFPARAVQAKAWEKGGVDPTRALNQHRGAGVGVKGAIHGSADSISTEEIQRATFTGAAGAGKRPDEAASGNPGKKQAIPEIKSLDHVAAIAFNQEHSPQRPHVSPLDLSKINAHNTGKRTKVAQEKRSPQAQRRMDNQFHASKKKNSHLQFSARRVHATHGPNALLKGYGSMTAVVSARARGTGKNQVTTAAGRKQNIAFKDGVGAESPSGPSRLTKTFHVTQRQTSFDNDFGRANHKSATAADKIDSPTAQKNLKHDARFGKKQLGASPKNSSLKGILNPETPRNRKVFAITRPFGDHTGQEMSPKKSVSAARIGWHGANTV